MVSVKDASTGSWRPHPQSQRQLMKDMRAWLIVSKANGTGKPTPFPESRLEMSKYGDGTTILRIVNAQTGHQFWNEVIRSDIRFERVKDEQAMLSWTDQTYHCQLDFISAADCEHTLRLIHQNQTAARTANAARTDSAAVAIENGARRAQSAKIQNSVDAAANEPGSSGVDCRRARASLASALPGGADGRKLRSGTSDSNGGGDAAGAMVGDVGTSGTTQTQQKRSARNSYIHSWLENNEAVASKTAQAENTNRGSSNGCSTSQDVLHSPPIDISSVSVGHAVPLDAPTSSDEEAQVQPVACSGVQPPVAESDPSHATIDNIEAATVVSGIATVSNGIDANESDAEANGQPRQQMLQSSAEPDATAAPSDLPSGFLAYLDGQQDATHSLHCIALEQSPSAASYSCRLTSYTPQPLEMQDPMSEVRIADAAPLPDSASEPSGKRRKTKGPKTPDSSAADASDFAPVSLVAECSNGLLGVPFALSISDAAGLFSDVMPQRDPVNQSISGWASGQAPSPISEELLENRSEFGIECFGKGGNELRTAFASDAAGEECDSLRQSVNDKMLNGQDAPLDASAAVVVDVALETAMDTSEGHDDSASLRSSVSNDSLQLQPAASSLVQPITEPCFHATDGQDRTAAGAGSGNSTGGETPCAATNNGSGIASGGQGSLQGAGDGDLDGTAQTDAPNGEQQAEGANEEADALCPFCGIDCFFLRCKLCSTATTAKMYRRCFMAPHIWCHLAEAPTSAISGRREAPSTDNWQSAVTGELIDDGLKCWPLSSVEYQDQFRACFRLPMASCVRRRSLITSRMTAFRVPFRVNLAPGSKDVFKSFTGLVNLTTRKWKCISNSPSFKSFRQKWRPRNLAVSGAGSSTAASAAPQAEVAPEAASQSSEKTKDQAAGDAFDDDAYVDSCDEIEKSQDSGEIPDEVVSSGDVSLISVAASVPDSGVSSSAAGFDTTNSGDSALPSARARPRRSHAGEDSTAEENPSHAAGSDAAVSGTAGIGTNAEAAFNLSTEAPPADHDGSSDKGSTEIVEAETDVLPAPDSISKDKPAAALGSSPSLHYQTQVEATICRVCETLEPEPMLHVWAHVSWSYWSKRIPKTERFGKRFRQYESRQIDVLRNLANNPEFIYVYRKKLRKHSRRCFGRLWRLKKSAELTATTTVTSFDYNAANTATDAAEHIPVAEPIPVTESAAASTVESESTSAVLPATMDHAAESSSVVRLQPNAGNLAPGTSDVFQWFNGMIDLTTRWKCSSKTRFLQKRKLGKLSLRGAGKAAVASAAPQAEVVPEALSQSDEKTKGQAAGHAFDDDAYVDSCDEIEKSQDSGEMSDEVVSSGVTLPTTVAASILDSDASSSAAGFDAETASDYALSSAQASNAQPSLPDEAAPPANFCRDCKTVQLNRGLHAWAHFCRPNAASVAEFESTLKPPNPGVLPLCWAGIMRHWKICFGTELRSQAEFLATITAPSFEQPSANAAVSTAADSDSVSAIRIESSQESDSSSNDPVAAEAAVDFGTATQVLHHVDGAVEEQNCAVTESFAAETGTATGDAEQDTPALNSAVDHNLLCPQSSPAGQASPVLADANVVWDPLNPIGGGAAAAISALATPELQIEPRRFSPHSSTAGEEPPVLADAFVCDPSNPIVDGASAESSALRTATHGISVELRRSARIRQLAADREAARGTEEVSAKGSQRRKRDVDGQEPKPKRNLHRRKIQVDDEEKPSGEEEEEVPAKRIRSDDKEKHVEQSVTKRAGKSRQSRSKPTLCTLANAASDAAASHAAIDKATRSVAARVPAQLNVRKKSRTKTTLNEIIASVPVDNDSKRIVEAVVESIHPTVAAAAMIQPARKRKRDTSCYDRAVKRAKPEATRAMALLEGTAAGNAILAVVKAVHDDPTIHVPSRAPRKSRAAKPRTRKAKSKNESKAPGVKKQPLKRKDRSEKIAVAVPLALLGITTARVRHSKA